MKKYYIKKGKHYTDEYSLFGMIPIPKLIVNQEYSKKFKINKVAFNGAAPEQDWYNKLWGFGTGLFSRSNSIRVVWEYSKKRNEISFNIYREVNKEFHFLDAIVSQQNEVVMSYNPRLRLFRIIVDNDLNKTISYEFDISNKNDNKLMNASFVWELHPAFGGKPASDADWWIEQIDLY